MGGECRDKVLADTERSSSDYRCSGHDPAAGSSRWPAGHCLLSEVLAAPCRVTVLFKCTHLSRYPGLLNLGNLTLVNFLPQCILDAASAPPVQAAMPCSCSRADDTSPHAGWMSSCGTRACRLNSRLLFVCMQAQLPAAGLVQGRPGHAVSGRVQGRDQARVRGPGAALPHRQVGANPRQGLPRRGLLLREDGGVLAQAAKTIPAGQYACCLCFGLADGVCRCSS
jgi:hypothetical protein